MQCESDREEKRMKKKKDISREAKGKNATKGGPWRKSLSISNSEAHSQEVLPNNDDSEVESICSLPINNQHEDCPLIDDYYASSDDEDELHSSPLKELFQKGNSNVMFWILLVLNPFLADYLM